jgi:DnaJ family protein B protein 12
MGESGGNFVGICSCKCRHCRLKVNHMQSPKATLSFLGVVWPAAADYSRGQPIHFHSSNKHNTLDHTLRHSLRGTRLPSLSLSTIHTMSSEKSRQHHDGSSGRAFTLDQKAAVVRVRKCSPTAFYDILGLESTKTTASESDIKKAYRKLSLLTHPDKNGYDGADEAFKMVARAFAVLSDTDKKAKFDRFGGDPDSRFQGASASSASPFSGGGATRRQAGGMFDDEISPEDLFRQFFGGGGGMGMGGGGFGNGGFGMSCTLPFLPKKSSANQITTGGGLFDGPGFAFNMGGGPGIRVHQFGGGAPRRRPQQAPRDPNAPPPTLMQSLQSLLPLLLLFIFPLLSGLFSGNGTPSGPSVRLDSTPPFTQQRVSSGFGIPYYVDPREVSDLSTRKWKELDKRADANYYHKLSNECEVQQQRRQQMYQQAQGFFFTDQVKLQQARGMEMPSCKRLNDLGYRT